MSPIFKSHSPVSVSFFCFCFTLAIVSNVNGQFKNGVSETIVTGESCLQNQFYVENHRNKIFDLKSDIEKIIDHVMRTKPGQTYKDLTLFVDKFGARFTGTENLEKSIDYMLDLLKREGHDNVHGESVEVPRWVGSSRTRYFTLIEILFIYFSKFEDSWQ